MVPAESHAQAAGYREAVVALQAQKDFPAVLPGVAPAVSVLRYHHLGLGCRDVAASAAFYAQLGFAALPGGDAAAARGAGILRLAHSNGLELHLLQADDVGGDNLLMDFADVKPPGHTHASWTVPSVPGVKDFLARLGVALSGTRSSLAVFVRDPDRTTLEFERNDGGDEPPPDGFGPQHVGSARALDHIGTRLRAPFPRHLEWYARNLGFTRLVRHYEPNPDPLKNGPPWITRTDAGCDINWIINANTAPPAAGEAAENALCAGGVVKPGILYAGFAIAEADAAAALARLRANGADAVLDTQLRGWCDLPPSAVRLFDGAPTVLIRDLNGNFLRLVPSPAA